MSIAPRYTSSDLELLPDVEGRRYEIIDGELHVSKQPSLEHQYACAVVVSGLHLWGRTAGLGRAYGAPGVIFAEDDDVAPDVVWVSNERLRAPRDAAGHLLIAPDLVVEVLSPGSKNERRDRELKLKLYSRQGVEEYWIVDPSRRRVEAYRAKGGALVLAATLGDAETLTSPLLTGFTLAVVDLWEPPT